jgi:branched-chain amino acid transport system permease protein
LTKGSFIQKKNINKILLATVLIILAILPLTVKSPYIIHLVIISLIWGVCAASWDLVFGYMGIFHFAQTAFLGVGAYASGLTCMYLSISPWWGILWSGIAAGVLSIALSLPTLRLKETYLTLVSLGFVFTVFYIVSSWTSFTKGENGLWGIPPLYDEVSKIRFYYTAFVLFILAMTLLYGIVKSRYGLALIAIKASEDSARSLGVEVTKVKIVIFLISAILTGITGWFYAHYILLVTPEILKMDPMITIMAMTVIGGSGSLAGPVLGAFLITFLLEYFRIVGEYRFIIYAAALFFIMMLKPKGIYGGIQSLIERTKPRS